MHTESAREDLAYLRQLIEDTRQATYVSGQYFIVWGVAVGLGLVATWLGLRGELPISIFLAWIICMAAGGLGTFLLVRAECNLPVQTHASRVIGKVWMTMGISMMVLFFAGAATGRIDGHLMLPLSCLLIAGPFYVTGLLARLYWMQFLAFAWWLGAAVMLLWPGMYNLLLMGLLLFALYVVPGIILVRMNLRAERSLP